MMHGTIVASIQVWCRKLSACSRRKTVTTVTFLLLLTTCFTYFTLNRNRWTFEAIADLPASAQDRFIASRHSTVLNFSKSTAHSLLQSSGISATQGRQTFPNNNAMGGGVFPDSESERNTYTTQPMQTKISRVTGSDAIADPNSVGAGLSSVRKSDDKEVYDENYIDSIPFDYGDDSDSDAKKSTEKNVSSHNPSSEASLPRKITVDLKTTPTSLTTSLMTDRTHTPIPLSKNLSSSSSNSTVSENYVDYKLETDSSWSSSPLRGQGEPLTDRDTLVYDPEDVNLLAVKPFQFLKDYKNPCWSEEVQTWYADNKYMEVENVQAVLTRMSAILRLRQERGDNHRIRCLPYFFIIGQPKCGSTDLYEKLMSHPQIVRPPTKEPHWWTRARLGRHRVFGQTSSLADYIDLFDYAAYNIEQHPIASPDTGDVFYGRITGDASMSTFWDNDHWWAMVGNENATEPRVLIQDYIHHLLPESKFVLILRNPSTRMYSDYLYFRKQIRVPQDFHNDVVNAIAVYENCTRDMSVRSCVYNRTVNSMSGLRLRVGMYSVFLMDWWRVFPREQFYIVRTEDYATDPKTVLQGLFKFLELNSLSESHLNQILSRKKANTRREEDRVIGDMLPETRALLDNFYSPTNKQLAGLLDDDRYLWKDSVPT